MMKAQVVANSDWKPTKKLLAFIDIRILGCYSLIETQVRYMDSMAKEKRRKIMSSIHSKDTSIEVKLRHALWHKGYRYRKNYKELPGKPDIALTKYKIAIFCDSEFFHGKDWYTILRPRLEKGANPDFWIHKIERNMERDDEVNKELTFRGWTVIRFWGEEIEKNLEPCIKVVEDCIFEARLNRHDAHLTQKDDMEMLP